YVASARSPNRVSQRFGSALGGAVFSQIVSTAASNEAATPAADAPRKADVAGRDRMGRNVAFAWGGYMVNVVTGFIVPRLISAQLGQTTLGIWDFSWSIVSYFGLVQLGLGSSVSRYVAKYRSVGDHHGLNVSVSTVAVFQ